MTGGGGGGESTLQSFVRGDSASRSTRLPFCISLIAFRRKMRPFLVPIFENRCIPFLSPCCNTLLFALKIPFSRVPHTHVF